MRAQAAMIKRPERDAQGSGGDAAGEGDTGERARQDPREERPGEQQGTCPVAALPINPASDPKKMITMLLPIATRSGTPSRVTARGIR